MRRSWSSMTRTCINLHLVGGCGLGTQKNVKEWKSQIEIVLESKAREFQIMGYSNATTEEIWNCLVEHVWKGNPSKRLYEVVQEIFHLKSTDYMRFLTQKAYQGDDLMASIQALMGDGESIE